MALFSVVRFLVLVVCAGWFSAVQAQPVPLQPIPPPPPQIIPLPPGPPNNVVVSCKPVEAASFPNMVRVKCDPAIDGRFSHFAVSTSLDPRFAARALSVIEAAQLGDKYLNIFFDVNDISGRLWGCFLDCRPLQGVTMVETPIPVNRCIFDTNRVGCPGYCAKQDDITCPGFCDRHATEVGCPGYCAANPTARECPGYCRAHATDPVCEARDDPCVRHPHIPACNPR